MNDEQIDEMAVAIAADLFTGAAVHADRLVLMGEHGRDLGGWCEAAVRATVGIRIAKIVTARLLTASKQPMATQIHDHFDGSDHCKECGGPCRLRDGDRTATELVRWMFERWARGYASAPDSMQRDTLTNAGVDIEAFKERALTNK